MLGKLRKYKHKKVTYEVLDWPMSVVRLSSDNENALLDAAGELFRKWQAYDNQELQIYSHTDADHNTVTPILKLDGAKYNLYMVLRNNYATEEKPYGLYHPREELFHIKKENIGLIEVMGLAILPGRLVDELELIEDCLVKGTDPKTIPELEKHLPWIDELKTMDIPEEEMKETLKKEVGHIFEQVLEDCNVFKHGNKEDLFKFVEKLI